MDERLNLARAFLVDTDWAGLEPVSLAGDASTRRYFRLHGVRPAVLMDAPPDKASSVASFLSVGSMLRASGLNAPIVFKEDADLGFLLLEDFGDNLFARLLETEATQEAELYRNAVDVLVSLHDAPTSPALPAPSASELAQMIEPVFTWYRWALTGDATVDRKAVGGLEAALQACHGKSIALRDYHAENLVWLPDRQGLSKVGLLDFQDAFVAPIGYDLVSLLLDARRDVPDNIQRMAMQRFSEAIGIAFDDLSRSFAILGLQRNLRILGVFARLCVKAGKPRYLDFLPRVWRYVETCAARAEVDRLSEDLRQIVPYPGEDEIEAIRDRCATAPNRP